MNTPMLEAMDALENGIDGELSYDALSRALFATDASVYRRLPLGVCFPKTVKDIQEIIRFASQNEVGLIPRTAGTSLAGQCVGDGLVVDVSKYFTEIISFDAAAKTVTVQPGVIRDDLNRFLAPHGLFFGPNTSTSNRCMIGGMVGNNSSGTTSIQHGVTRDKVVALQTILSDGSLVVFKALSNEEFLAKKKLPSLEGEIYRTIAGICDEPENREAIRTNFPKASIHRRNTGYALDSLIAMEPFSANQKVPLNICSLLAGSEGTLAFTTAVTLQLDPLPPKHTAMIAAHFKTISDCLHAVVPVMQHRLFTCEMMDKVILDCTKNNIEQRKNRFFIQGDPKAILMLELKANDKEELTQQIDDLRATIEKTGLAYAQPVLFGADIGKAMALRSAGLGLLGNIVGDRKAVACIEDTAVALEDLADYIDEFSLLMQNYKQQAVYYAHAGAGEIHLRPILNLKKSTDVALFKKLTDEIAVLVKKYNGSMSGEHGDGIVRASYIPQLVGAHCFDLMREVKTIFDPNTIFNPGKIIDPYPMDRDMRTIVDREEPEIKTLLDFSSSQGILRLTEKCNGSGDCRKSIESGGTMCPSYRATKNEKDTTRGRANALREFLTNSEQPNKFDSEALKTVFDLCISCKGCASECPSNVDVASLKAEFEYQYQKANGIPLRTKLFAFNNRLNEFTYKFAGLSNWLFKNNVTAGFIKNTFGIAKERTLPMVQTQSLRDWIKRNLKDLQPRNPVRKVYFFVDEFTNYLDTSIGIDALVTLTQLGYYVDIVQHKESGRSFISKGLLEQAQQVANHNIEIFHPLLSSEIPLIGLEPSAILSFRDEYLKLAKDPDKAAYVAKNTFVLDEFLAKEFINGVISATQFTTEQKEIKVHGHCHQKALGTIHDTFTLLNIPENFTVRIINSGCCGMAGSFGYEKEHYAISMAIGEQQLFPAVRNADEETIIAASGTSCRHQIKDGTSKKAVHPITVLKNALITT